MPEIIEEIFKSIIVGHIKTNTENDLILKESIRFAKTYGKKYKLIPCKKIDYMHITSEDHKVKNLYRVKALKSFSDVNKGDIGGIIDKSSVLSHAGNCWIYDDAIVMNESYVTDDADIDLHDLINEKCSHIIGLNEEICSDKIFINVHGFGKDKSPITFFKCSDNKIRCIINNDFSGDFFETKEYLLKNSGEDYDGEFDNLIEYAKKKLNPNEEK